METLCKTLYDPLYDFCGPLHTAFPTQTPGFDRLVACRQCLDWGLVNELGPGCTKALLVACLSRDPTLFFVDDQNPFVHFIGGKKLYDSLLEPEKEIYWGSNRLENLIRQCMVLHALEPMSAKLQCIISKLTASKTQKIDKSNIVNTLLTDPTMMSSMLSLMDSPAAMKTLMSSLRTIVEGMMTDAPESEEDENDGTKETPTETDGTKETPTETDTSMALASPGMFLKANRQKHKNRKNKNRKKKSAVPDLMSMIGDMKLDDEDLVGISEDISAMKSDEFNSIAGEIAKLLDGDGIGGLQQMMKSGGLQQLLKGKGMEGMLKGLSGADDVQSLLQGLFTAKAEKNEDV